MCLRLTELTVIYPYPHCVQLVEAGVMLDSTRSRAHSAISELVVACKALPDFDTFQIVRIPIGTPCLLSWGQRLKLDGHTPTAKHLEQALKGQTEDVRDWAMDYLKKSGTGRREGATLRVIDFSPGNSPELVEEYEV